MTLDANIHIPSTGVLFIAWLLHPECDLFTPLAIPINDKTVHCADYKDPTRAICKTPNPGLLQPMHDTPESTPQRVGISKNKNTPTSIVIVLTSAREHPIALLAINPQWTALASDEYGIVEKRRKKKKMQFTKISSSPHPMEKAMTRPSIAARLVEPDF